MAFAMAPLPGPFDVMRIPVSLRGRRGVASRGLLMGLGVRLEGGPRPRRPFRRFCSPSLLVRGVEVTSNGSAWASWREGCLTPSVTSGEGLGDSSISSVASGEEWFDPVATGEALPVGFGSSGSAEFPGDKLAGDSGSSSAGCGGGSATGGFLLFGPGRMFPGMAFSKAGLFLG